MKRVELTPGKLRGLQILSDEEGKFRMMAIDQRGSLKKALAKALSIPQDEVKDEDVVKTKIMITKVLSPYASAVLTDPVYGFPYTMEYIPRDVGILLAYEKTGYEKAQGGRKTSLLPDWSGEKIKRAGANAIKLLLYYRPDGDPEVGEYQREIVRKVGEEAKKYDIPFLLEPVGYEIEEPGKDSLEYAQQKPKIVIETVREFTKEEYGIDVLKLEFPADLKYTEEFAHGEFDGKEREPAYDLYEVEDICEELNDTATIPWVLLSAGVDIEEFLINVEIATAHGASGFLAGRAIWKDAVPFYPDLDKMEKWLSTEGVDNFVRLYKASEEAVPYYKHKKFGNFANIDLKDRGVDWHKNY